MPRYRLNVDALRQAATKAGDTTPGGRLNYASIGRRAGIKRDVVSRLMNGRDLSLGTLLRLSKVYGVSANDLALEYDDEAECAARAA